MLRKTGFILIAVALLVTACGNKNEISIQTSTKRMEQTLVQMKKDISASQQKAVQQGAAQLEKQWSAFEEKVKQKSTTLYEKVEGPLDLIRAGAKQTKLNSEILNKYIDQLQAVLVKVKALK